MKQHKQKCSVGNKLKFIRFSTILVKTITNITKNIFFNILVFSIGFGLGYTLLLTKIYNEQVKSDVKECIVKIDRSIQAMEKLDQDYIVEQKKIRNLIKDIQLKIICCNTNSFIHSCD